MHAAHIAGAVAPGAAPPEWTSKDETPGLAGNGGFAESDENKSAHCTDNRVDGKAIATLTAKVALAGFELVKLAGGTWEARRWGLVRPLTRLADVRAWLERVAGGAR